MPDKPSNSPTSDEAARIAKNALDALNDAVKAGGDLSADTAKLLLNTLRDVTSRVESVVRHATGGKDA